PKLIMPPALLIFICLIEISGWFIEGSSMIAAQEIILQSPERTFGQRSTWFSRANRYRPTKNRALVAISSGSPIMNPTISGKAQAPFGIWNLRFVWDLGFGIWSF